MQAKTPKKKLKIFHKKNKKKLILTAQLFHKIKTIQKRLNQKKRQKKQNKAVYTSKLNLRKFLLKIRFIKLYKLIAYFFSRQIFFHINELRLKYRISKKLSINSTNLNINFNICTKNLCDYFK